MNEQHIPSQPQEPRAFMFPVGDRQIVVVGNPLTDGKIAVYKKVESEKPQTREQRVRQVVKDTVTRAFLPAVGLGVAAVAGSNILHPAEYKNLAEFAQVNFPLFAQVTAPALIGLSSFIAEGRNHALIKQKWPVLTAGFVALNTAAYVAGKVNPEIYNWFTQPAGGIIEQAAKIATAPFLHADGQHLLNNMIPLALLGTQAERRLGSGKMLLTYLASSMGGNILRATTGDPTLGIGASSGDFGLLGLGVVNAVKDKKFGKGTALAAAASLLTFHGQLTAGIDQLGHVAGLATGALAGVGNWVGEKIKPKRIAAV